MKLKAGTFTHRINECGIKISKQPENDAAGVPWAHRVRWDISARILNESGDPKDIDSVIATVEAVYDTELSYIGLLHDDNTETGHVIDANDTLGGIRVVVPASFPNNEGSEYVTYRKYVAAIEAIIPIRTGSTLVYSLEESVDYKPSGAVYGFLQPNEGPPVKQQLRTQTPYYATQSGTIIGIEGYLDLPDPIWPSHQLVPVQYTARSPRKIGDNEAGYYLFPIQYRYEFGSITSLVGNPTVW